MRVVNNGSQRLDDEWGGVIAVRFEFQVFDSVQALRPSEVPK